MWKTLKAASIVLLMIAVAAAAAQKLPKAEEILKDAKLKAADKNKAIYLIFGASWCEACHQLDSFLGAPAVAVIFDKYFIIAKVSVGEAAAGHPAWDNPGSDSLMMKYGGVTASGEAGLPFIALLDQKAKLIVNSNNPKKGKNADAGTGFPTEPAEIDWFLSMLKKAAPAITEDETRTIQEGLKKAAAESSAPSN
jgi:thiol-disulfide isomerase/thioredoxin